jgi:hypothetical protein
MCSQSPGTAVVNRKNRRETCQPIHRLSAAISQIGHDQIDRTHLIQPLYRIIANRIFRTGDDITPISPEQTYLCIKAFFSLLYKMDTAL